LKTAAWADRICLYFLQPCRLSKVALVSIVLDIFVRSIFLIERLNEAVAVTTGASVLTDIGAFTILVVLLGAELIGEVAIAFLAMLEQESISSFIVTPGFGSRKRVADTLGHLPERLAAPFDSNLAILHFDN